MVLPLVFTLVAVCGLFWLAYRRPRPRRWLLPRQTPARAVTHRGSASVVAAVDRQHRHLQAGGLIGEAAFAATQSRFEELLASGRLGEIEEELRPGLDFAVCVKALTEVGTPDAAVVLERQLNRELSPDPVEQAWYWVDVSGGLRKLNHTSALPAVMRCADAAAELLQGVVLSAEAVSFPNFPATLHDLTTSSGRLAVRALARATRGCRDGTIDASAMIRAGLGDHLAAVSETAPPAADPWLIDAVIEAERIARRIEQWTPLLAPDARPLAQRQGVRLAASAERRCEWLYGAASRLIDRFGSATDDERVAGLRTLNDLQADAADLFAERPDRLAPWWSDAIRALTWAKPKSIGLMLSALAASNVGFRRESTRLAVVLSALRGHRCRDSEQVLMKAVSAADPVVRRAAYGAIGWWVPFDSNVLIPLLRRGRIDPNSTCRRAAVAALARLGERAAILEFSEQLASEEPGIRQMGALAVAAEGLTWLWPEVQELAESTDPDTALTAIEALERMRELTLGLLQ